MIKLVFVWTNFLLILLCSNNFDNNMYGPFKSCLGWFFVYFCLLIGKKNAVVFFLGREGSSICITKRFEQQVLFWMFVLFFCLHFFFVYIFLFVFSSLFQKTGTRKKVNALWVSSLHLCFSIVRVGLWYAQIYFLCRTKSVHFSSTSLNPVHHPECNFLLAFINQKFKKINCGGIIILFGLPNITFFSKVGFHLDIYL